VRVSVFDWDDLFRFAVLILRVTPQQFWQLRLREVITWLQALQPRTPSASAEELQDLMKEFPDR